MSLHLASSRSRHHGFTLIELVVVIVVGGLLAASLTVFLRPSIDGYLSLRRRAELLAEADAVLTGMVREVRRAVPNSVRTPGDQCFELVPARGGGRMRIGPDTVNDSGVGCTPGAQCSAVVDTSAATSVFDVLAASGDAPAAGDWVVINNQNGNDVYQGGTRSQITAVATPNAAFGVSRLSIQSFQVSPGYDGARYSWVADQDQAVFYGCIGADGSVDDEGNGRGRLVRLSRYGFNSGVPSACPSSGGEVLASHVRRCSFVYDPNQGATQQSGFVWLDLELAIHGEVARLGMGAHVMNVP